MLAIISVACQFMVLQASAEDIEETVKYKAPTMDQAIGFINKMTSGTVNVDPTQCLVTTKMVKNNRTFEYLIPLKKINPSPNYVKPHLNNVILTVEGYEKEIKRVDENGDVEMRSKVELFTRDEDSADKVARAMRYLISLCGGPPCVDCDPFMWQ
jgi:archaellum component FlaF (FlaF/FlaG flagellin family)